MKRIARAVFSLVLLTATISSAQDWEQQRQLDKEKYERQQQEHRLQQLEERQRELEWQAKKRENEIRQREALGNRGIVRPGLLP